MLTPDGIPITSPAEIQDILPEEIQIKDPDEICQPMVA